MAAKDYMKVNRDNTITINLDNYTGNAFMDAVKVRDVAQVKILNRKAMKGRPSGSPDVAVLSVSGETKYITRKELVQNYEYLSGKKVVIPYMKNDVIYKVVGKCDIPFAVMLLPANMNGILKGQPVAPGTYIVAPKNPDGTINYGALTAVNRRMFRKMFKIPNQEVIAKNVGRNTKVSQRIFSKKSNRQKFLDPNRNMMQKTPVNNLGISPLDAASNIGNNMGMPMGGNVQQSAQKQAPRKQYPYSAVGAIYDQSNNLVAYKIQDTKGQIRDLYKNAVLALAEKQEINNLEVVKHDRGMPYLRGRGISINQLPRYMA